MPIPVDTNSADIDTTMALRQQGALQSETAALYQTIRQFGSGTGAWTTDTRAARISSVGMAEDDQWYETDTGWLYRYEGAAWKYALGRYTGTNAQRAAISPTAADNGAWFYTTDTERLWQVSSAAWVERVIVSKKMLETAGPTVLTYGAVADGEYLKRSGTNVVGSAVGGGSPAPSNSSYVVISADGTLTDERVLTGTANQITITDGGAGGNVTLSLDPTLAAFAALTIAANSLTIGTGADAFSQTTFAANTFPARASTGNLVAKTVSDFALTILDDADGTAVRTTIGAGTVTTVSVVTANGVSGSVATATTTPAITLTLGAITPTSVNGLTITTSTGTLTITNGKTLSVSNTLTFTGTDSSSVAFGTGGTVVYTTVTTLSSLVSVGTITTGTWGATTIAVDKGGTGQTTYTNGQLLIGNTTGNTLTKATLTGTSNQVVVTNGTGSITLSTPQDIHTSATPQFSRMGLGVAADASYSLLATASATDTAPFTNFIPGGTAVFRNSSATDNNYTALAFGNSAASGFLVANIVAVNKTHTTTPTGYLAFGIKNAGTLAERVRFDENGNVKIAGTATRATTEGTNHIDIFNGTAPAGTLTNGVSIYATAGEGRIMDAAGNATLLSPHDKDGNWIHDEMNFKGRRLRVDMERLVKAVDHLLGGGYVTEWPR